MTCISEELSMKFEYYINEGFSREEVSPRFVRMELTGIDVVRSS
jgi:hypothetical protein